MDAQEDFASLPIADRLQHKVWKARVSGCEDLTKLLHKTVEDSDFYTYEPFLKKIVTDANAVAQEAGLAAVVEYVTNAPNASSTRETIIPSLVDKCLGATKQGTKQRATDVILLYAEIDTPDPVVELVLPGLGAKQPKLVTQTVLVLKELVRQFGTKKVSPKPIIKVLPKLFGHTDKNVRAEASALTVELYRWIGQAIMNSISDLKPVQIKELEEQFNKLPADKPKPERLIRSEQAVEEEEDQADEGAQNQMDEDADEPEEAEMDAYDLADPVDITAKLPNNFYELLASKKWQERKEALEALLEQAKTPKIMDKDYSELMTALSKRINDANILLVGLTATCVETIANGLRQDFAKFKAILTPVIIEKLKERKPAILEQLSNAMNAVFASVPLSEITEDITVGSKHKNPQVRAECIKLVSRRLKEIKQMPEKNDVKQLSEIMKKTLDDADANAREAAAEGLGTMMKLIGEKPMLAFTDGLDDIKMGKIKEYFEKAVVKAKPAKKAAPPPPVKKSSAPVKKPVAKPKPKPKPASPEPMELDEPVASMSPPKRKPPARLTSASTKKPALSSSKPKPAAAAAATSGPKKSAKLPPSSGPEEIRYKYSQEDADARATEFIPENIYTELGQAQWKARLAAIESFCQHLEREDGASVEPEIVIRALSKKPGWKEMNFQVMAKLFLVIQTLATECPKFNKACAALSIPVMVEKLGDIKLKKPAGECLVVIAEKTSLQFVFSQTYPVLKTLKSPKVLADSLIWIHTSLMDFGISGLQVRDLIDLLKFALSNTNASVRTSAVTVLGALRQYIGPEVKSFVEDVSPALLANIEAEFERVSKLDPPQPTKAPATNGGSDEGGGGRGGGGGGGSDAIESLFPRVDISNQLGKTIAECNDASWKIRKEGLEKVLGIISGANNRIKPSLGPDFPGMLKQRLNDSNKNLQTTAVEIAGLLAVAMGQPFDKYLKPLTGPVIAVLSDNKANVRAAGVATLEHFRKTCTMENMVSVFGTSLSADSPSLRKELLTWISTSIKEEENASKYDFTSMLSPLLNCLQDRNADVRKAAQACLPEIIAAAGYDTVMSKTSELKAAQRQTVLPLIEAARGSAPASTPKKAAEPVAEERVASPAAGSGSPSRLRTPVKKKLGLPAPRSHGASSSSAASAATEDSAPPVLTSDPRSKLVRAKKENKWQFDAPRSDIIENLKGLFDTNMSPEVTNLLFSTSQYAEKDRLNGMTILNDCMASPDASESKYGVSSADMTQRYVVNADLIFKYLTIRFFDTNTSMLIKCLDIAENLVAILDKEGYHLSEYEANSFLPFLIAKVGDSKEIMRTRIKNILKAICRIYPASKVFHYLLDGAAGSKNAKTRAECLEEVAWLIQRNGISVMLPNKALPLIAVHIGDRDAGVRNAALNGIAQAYILIGDVVMKYMTRLGEKEKGMLEERLKRTKPSATVLAAVEKERAKQREAEEMEVDELPSLNNLPRPGGRSQIGKPRSSLQRQIPAPVVHHKSVPEPMEDVLNDYGQRVSETSYQQPQQYGQRNQSEMRQPRSVQYGYQQQQVYQQHSQAQTTGVGKEDLIAYLISQITDADPQPSIDALKRLDYLLGDSPDVILPDIEKLIHAITLQVRIAYPAIDPDQPTTIRLCKHLVNALVLLFSNGELARAVSQESLHHLIQELAHRLLEIKKKVFDAEPQLSKALNVAMVKVLENCKRNITFSALLSILGTSSAVLRSGDSLEADSTKYTELIMKCLWKLAKTVKDNLRMNTLNPDELLFDINQFFINNPPADWKRRADENVPLGEMPLRTVKTILLELVTGLGDNIYQHLTLIEQPERSSVYAYIQLLLEAWRKKGNKQIQPQPQLQQFQQPQQPQFQQQQQQQMRQSIQSSEALMNHSRNSSLSRPSSISSLKSNTMIRSPSIASYSSVDGNNIDHNANNINNGDNGQPISNNYSPRMQSQTIQPMEAQKPEGTRPMSDPEFNHILTQIFTKIGQRENTKEGIAELYGFQKKYPYLEGKINNYLSQTGGHFQSYIKRALSNLAAEDSEMQATASASSAAAAQAAVQAAASAFANNPDSNNYNTATSPVSEQQHRYSMDSARYSSDRNSSIHTGDEAADIKLRFHRLQQKFGYSKAETEDNGNGGLSTAEPSYSTFSKRQSSISLDQNDSDKPTSVSALKERLAKMKQAINSAASSNI